MVCLPDNIFFTSDSFSLIGRKVNEVGWYDFDAAFNGVESKDIGGDAAQKTLKKLCEILNKQHGTSLKLIRNARYKDIVGGDNSEYIGYVVLSGYSTLLLFSGH